MRGAVAFASAAAFSVASLNDAFAQAGATYAGPLNMGVGDVGILNFALVLEELEASFYTHVLRQPYLGMARHERRVIQDVHDHEVAHARFLRRTLGSAALPPAPFNFGAVNFADRAAVLTTSPIFDGIKALHPRNAAAVSPAGDVTGDAADFCEGWVQIAVDSGVPARV